MHSSPELVTDTLLTPFFDSQCEPRNCTMFSTAFLLLNITTDAALELLDQSVLLSRLSAAVKMPSEKKWRAANVLTLSKLEGVLK